MKFDFEYECDKDWDEMKGGDRRRFCDSCDKHVHHISGMTEAQARKFLEDHDYEVCVDFYRDADGHTKFREAARKLRMQNDGLKQLLASAAALVPLALAAAFIDFDKPAVSTPAVVSFDNPTPVEPSSSVDPSPINLDGTSPVITPVVEPTHVQPAAIEPWMVEPDTIDTPEPPTPVQPFVHDVEEPELPTPDVEPEPVIKPRPHVRGRIRRPADWHERKPEPIAEKPTVPVTDFNF